MEEKKITVSDEALRRAAGEGMDEFLQVFTDRYLEVTGGQIDAGTMPLLIRFWDTACFAKKWARAVLYNLSRTDTVLTSFSTLLRRRCA